MSEHQNGPTLVQSWWTNEEIEFNNLSQGDEMGVLLKNVVRVGFPEPINRISKILARNCHAGQILESRLARAELLINTEIEACSHNSE